MEENKEEIKTKRMELNDTQFIIKNDANKSSIDFQKT